MTSQINANNIDGNYPVAGQPNNTQGMRDNFTNTKTNFQFAADEITNLQNNVVVKAALPGTTLDNNMNDGLIYAVQLNDVSWKDATQTATAGSITLDYAAGAYQTFASITGSISLGFSNFPTTGVGLLRLGFIVTNTAYTVTLPAAVSVGLVAIDGISPGTAGVSNTITFAAPGFYGYELTSADGGNTIAIQALVRPTNTYSNIIEITNTTPSTSDTTGALIVAGGVGIGANLHVGGDFYTYNTSNVEVFSVDSTTGYVHINTGNIPGNSEGALNIVGSSTGAYQPIVNSGGMIHITSNDDAAARVTVDAFGASATTYPTLIQRRARGTAASPGAVQSGDILARLAVSGWGNGNYNLVANAAPTSVDFVATENFATANSGSKIDFYTSNIGAITRTLSATVTGNLTTFPRAVSVTGNITAGNISGATVISTTGNIITTSNVLLADGGTMGYNTGAGGTIAQSGNKTQTVVLNKPSGEITMQNTALGGDTSVSFTLTNSTISARDLLLMNVVGGVATPGTYNLDANCTTGSAVITVRNITTGSLSEALVIRFAVIRGSIA